MLIVRHLSDRELTDSMVLDVSKRITDELDLRDLATKGLKVEVHITDKHINTERSIHLAAFKVLSDWRKRQPNSRIAYSKLHDAFEHVKMLQFIEGIL